jgi:two-component system NtrC family sensor kinase/two-component system sensor histidine kinase AtoS
MSSTLKKRVIPENVPIVEEIQRSVKRIDRIIKATLMFSKGVEASKSNFMWSDLRKSIDESISYYAYSKDIEFIYPQNDFTLHADKDLLEMLFSNFIINAIDAIELDDNEDGVVKITHKNDGYYHYFYIYDTGIAIEEKKDLFEAFKSTKVKGNGLGLVLSRQIAQAHNGSVDLVDSTQKCFEIKLAL